MYPGDHSDYSTPFVKVNMTKSVSPTSFGELPENASRHLETFQGNDSKFSGNPIRLFFAEAFKIVLTIAVVGLLISCCYLCIKCHIMEAKQHEYEEKLAILSRVTEKLLLNQGDYDSLQELKEAFDSIDMEEYGSRTGEEDSNTPVIRQERDAQENGEVPCPPDIHNRMKRAGKKRKNPRRPKIKKGPPGSCTCNVTSIIEVYLNKTRKEQQAQASASLPSTHMVGHNGRIQTTLGQFFTWSHRYRDRSVDLAHSNLRQEDSQYIDITQTGYYYVYSQVMYSDGRSPNVGHETVVKRGHTIVTLMKSGATEESSGVTPPSDSAYHGGVFRLLQEDKLGVRPLWSGQWIVDDPTKSFFGAFRTSASPDDGIIIHYTTDKKKQLVACAKMDNEELVFSLYERDLNEAYQVLLHRLENNTLSDKDKFIVIDCLCQHGLVTLDEVMVGEDSEEHCIEYSTRSDCDVLVNNENQNSPQTTIPCENSDNVSSEQTLPAFEKHCVAYSAVNNDNESQTNERPFLHEECGTSFTHSSAVKVDMRVHTNERPFVCKEYECGKGFNQNYHLKEHMRIHTNERPPSRSRK
ncbi:uncharacterized protein LOC144442082 [Glandiceps talaboti]